MLILATALIAGIAALAALIAGSEPPTLEAARIQEARQTLREAGFDYEPNSPEEVRALRILLEGGPLSEC